MNAKARHIDQEARAAIAILTREKRRDLGKGIEVR
jgi:hypothetical protein